MEKRRKFCLALGIAVFAVLIMTASPVLAYFSDHSEATGKIPVELGSTTTMEEKVEGFVKSITITNKGPESCFVRARAYAGENLKLAFDGKGWSKGTSDDGWYYYEKVLDADDTTEQLDVTISNVPEDAEEGDSFNVVVVYESVKAIYSEDGEPLPADWSMKGIEGSDE